MSPEMGLVPATAAADAPPQVVGGKGRQLGRLLRYGLPVPDFFVIPAAWSRQRGAGVPLELQRLLQAELTARGWLDKPLAARSSALGEDAAAASFAGIYRSCLNIGDFSALTAAIAEVWASLDTPTAAAYRQRLGIAGDVAMAVVVMPLLAAEASGIAFTCDPASGREDRIIVHANWGLGESLVGGEAAGDEYVFAEDSSDTWRLIETRIGSKATISRPAAAGGTVRESLPPAKAQAAVFDAGQAERLVALLRDAAVACDFVAPFYDFEWVWDGGQFWLTQARPVTRRPHYTYPALRGQPALWTRGNTCEIMPEPLQAMDWNFSRRGCNDLLEQGWKLAGYPLLPGVQRAGLFDGRLYLEASILQWEAWDGIGLLPERFNALMGGHQPVIASTPPNWRERLGRIANTLRYLRQAPAMGRRGDAEVAQARAIARQLRDVPLPECNEEITALLLRVLKPAREFAGMFFLQGSGGGSLSLLLDTLERAFPGESAALGAALLAGGEPSVTAEQGYALLDLARQAKSAKTGGRPQDDPEFAAAFAAFLDRYGHRGHYETYLRSPRWHEEPEQLLEQLPALAEVDAAALRARIAERSARFARWQATEAREWLALAPAGQALPVLRSTDEKPAKPDEAGGFRGVATGTGVARGRVRRLRHPSEGLALQPGEILVAPSTDPGWTPLFLKAGGLVVETGGYLSHGAIVAREFALPAVVNLPGIVDQLRDGELIEVDGIAGMVRRLVEVV
ncbi:PEP/pyruvate-binding domain-containing protein [Dechloromonas hortensis]|uniref:PEP/pyruvate-binding domain-containing protein n=1 Tax=Dechloromonas hortensis TaxID=337779 RepID=UPI001291AE5F|nr:PEP/pyruvate-binding domain-containing protein [Dechloromonas hortensis]